MILENKNETPELYAKLYSKYKIKGTPYLPYRDVPQILKEYVFGKKVLDYGSGSGESTLFLKSLGYNVTGVDINEVMLEKAKAIDPMGEYITIDSGRIPVGKETYDLVFCSFVLLEISSKKEILEILKDISRVLKKEGVFIAIVGNENTYNHEWLSLNTDFSENKTLVSGQRVKIEFRDIDLTIFDYYWTKEDYVELVEAAELTLLKIHDPKGLNTDGYDWKDEFKVAPSSIIIARK
jgi:ubiquinone/menaquinone biosynthesis C-methylase UbiE